MRYRTHHEGFEGKAWGDDAVWCLMSCAIVFFTLFIPPPRSMAQEDSGPVTSIRRPKPTARERTKETDSAAPRERQKAEVATPIGKSSEEGTKLYVPPPLTDAELNVTEDDAEHFALNVLDAVYDDVDFPLLDEKRFAQLIRAGFPESDQNAMKLSTDVSMPSIRNVRATIRQLVKSEVDYRVQKIFRKDQRIYVRFRLLFPSGSLNYHTYSLMNRDGEILADDIGMMSNGELLSSSQRRVVAIHAADQKLGVLRLVPGVRNPLVLNEGKISEIVRLTHSDPARALELNQSLPATLQQEKLVLLLKMTAATNLEDEATAIASLRELNRLYPDDPTTQIHEFTILIAEKKYSEAMESIARLEKSLLGDPVLNIQRAVIEAERENFQKAAEYAWLATEEVPEVLWIHWVAVAYSLNAKDHPETLKFLKVIDQRFEIEWNDLTMVEEYAEFAKSPEHGTWLKYREEQEKLKPKPEVERL